MNLKTTLHTYRFDVSKPAEREAYDALRERLKGLGLKMTEFLGGHVADKAVRDYRDAVAALDGQTVELETDFIFDDQWNTAPIGDGNGLRVWDWKQDLWPNRDIKSGQWLWPTDLMRKVRAETLKCGYCGKHYRGDAIPADRFCHACIDSAYLEQGNLHLLRLLPAGASFGAKREPLSEAEQALWHPIFQQAQIHGATERGKARIAKARANIEAKYEKAIANATAERDGMRWILDHAPGYAENAIFYDHTGRWCFGWRKSVSVAAADELIAVMREFPFNFDIAKADGSKLSVERS